MMDRLRSRIDGFLTALEAERYEIDKAQRRKPELGELYAAAGDLFSAERITEVQRALAGSGGAEEKQNRSLLEFLARGRALAVAGEHLDQRIGWEIFGSAVVEENRIPVRQIDAALAVASDPEWRHAVEEAHLEAVDDQAYLAADFLARHRDAIGELGYGSHVDAYQVLGSIDLHAMVREGERFLADTEGLYRDLLTHHLPRHAGVGLADATAADGVRLTAGVEYDGQLRGGEGHRLVMEAIGASGIHPFAEGRLEVEWEAYLGTADGGVCRPMKVPAEIRLSVTHRSGRPAVESFLRAYGVALHHGYTDPAMPVEHRRLGDDSVTMASGELFESLLRAPYFLVRVYGFPRTKLQEYLTFAALCSLVWIRRQIALLRYEVAFFEESAEAGVYTELLRTATRLEHDPRAAVWSIDGEFMSARRLRAVQLGATLAAAARSRFDEDWFRNPGAGDFLKNLFASGRRYSAPELAVQVSSTQLSYAPVVEALQEIAG